MLLVSPSGHHAPPAPAPVWEVREAVPRDLGRTGFLNIRKRQGCTGLLVITSFSRASLMGASLRSAMLLRNSDHRDRTHSRGVLATHASRRR